MTSPGISTNWPGQSVEFADGRYGRDPAVFVELVTEEVEE